MLYNFEFGSRTAKGGFANEKVICDKFNNWKEGNTTTWALKNINIAMNSSGKEKLKSLLEVVYTLDA